MKKLCVIGHPISHSKSPILHEAGFREMNIEATFEAISVAPENLEEWIEKEFRPNYDGAAVTIPHKEAIRTFLDFETEAVKQIGACNTLFWEKDTLGGTNTDTIGVLRAISTVLDPNDKNVLVLGAGGAARATVFGLKSAGANVVIWNRNHNKAKELAGEFECIAIDDFMKIDPSVLDLIINMTPVGMKEDKSIIPKDFWLPRHVAFDAVYEPLETKFLFEAEQAGAQTISGDQMLIFQALEQFRIWHDVELEPEVMGQAFFN